MFRVEIKSNMLIIIMPFVVGLSVVAPETGMHYTSFRRMLQKLYNKLNTAQT